MTLKQKAALFIIALGIILAAAFVFLWTNLDQIVKSAIEKYGSQAVGTAVRVDGVSLEIAKGKGAIRGLTVANPRGYSEPHIISLGGISVRLSPRTVTENPVVIDDIRITSPFVDYEMNKNLVANVDVLKKNLEGGPKEKPGPKPAKTAAKDEKRVRIKRLVIENAKAEVRIASIGDKPRTVVLGRIEMNDIGGTRGAPPDIVAKEIVSAILSEVGKEVGKAGAERLIEKGLERMFPK
jgi:hypothetical protein